MFSSFLAASDELLVWRIWELSETQRPVTSPHLCPPTFKIYLRASHKVE